MDDSTLVPARIVNEHVYCPRLAWLEWEAKAFAHSPDTAEGVDLHARTDQESGSLDPEDLERVRTATSVTLSSDRLGVIAKLDKIETEAGVAVPVEIKRGRPREGDVPVWDPELAQLAIQVLLLEEQGFEVPHAEVYFAEVRGRRKVEVPVDSADWIVRLVDEIRTNAARGAPPPPLIDSPKCPRCSLVGICLPDETNVLAGRRTSSPPRRLVAGDAPSQPLYVTRPGALLRKRSKRLELEYEGERLESRRLIDVSHLALLGNVTVTAAAMRACMDADIPVLWFTHGNWFTGYAVPHGGSWVARRQAQYAVAADSTRSVRLARCLVAGKIRNQRTILRRLHRERDDAILKQLAGLERAVLVQPDLGSLLGIEGVAARLYFGSFSGMLVDFEGQFEFSARNRRPPTDPVNALLSFCYALLLRDATVSCLAAGLDPQVGILHQPRFGRPSLALDLAEEFRPIVADSTVIGLINNSEIAERHFVRRGGAISLTSTGRKAVIGAYERRVGVEITHPLFDYKTTYRRAMELQGRQMAAVLEGQFESYQPLTTR